MKQGSIVGLRQHAEAPFILIGEVGVVTDLLPNDQVVVRFLHPASKHRVFVQCHREWLCSMEPYITIEPHPDSPRWSVARLWSAEGSRGFRDIASQIIGSRKFSSSEIDLLREELAHISGRRAA